MPFTVQIRPQRAVAAPLHARRPHAERVETAHSLAHLPQLDAMRGIACLLVLVAHLQKVEGLSWLPGKMGTVGVGVFFALSGFLITRILIAEKQSGHGLNAFYNRRAARIFPIYFLSLAVLSLAWPGKEIGWAAMFSFNLHYLTGVREYFHIDAGAGIIPPIAHVWSLCVEEHFYWFWPALVCLLPVRVCRWLPVACIAATPVVTSLVVDQLTARAMQPVAIEGLVSRLTLTQLVAISFGALAAFYERPLTQTVKIGGLAIRMLPLWGGMLLAFSIALWQFLRVWPDAEHLRLLCRPTLLHMACGSLFALGLACPPLGRQVWLNRIGRTSYGLYLYHLPIYALFGLAQAGSAVAPWRGVAALVATLIVAAISSLFFERPVLNWMNRRQAALMFGRGRLTLSLGSALSILLAGICGVDAAQWLRDHPVMPAEWRYASLVANGVARPAADISEKERGEIAGAVHAYRWMGAVHAVDADWFRRTTPVPARRPGVARAAIVGDSYAWGACVAADQVLASVAERIVRDRGVSIEVLNLAKPGGQVEDILTVLADKVLPLHPDVVVYAATVDDFAPAGAASSRYTLQQYRTEPVFADRFRRSIRTMHEACLQNGAVFRLIPLTQSIDEAQTMATVAFIQSLCRSEGISLIDIDGYLREYAGLHFRSSRWDGHPNAACHRLYGAMVAAELLRIRGSEF